MRAVDFLVFFFIFANLSSSVDGYRSCDGSIGDYTNDKVEDHHGLPVDPDHVGVDPHAAGDHHHHVEHVAHTVTVTRTSYSAYLSKLGYHTNQAVGTLEGQF